MLFVAAAVDAVPLLATLGLPAPTPSSFLAAAVLSVVAAVAVVVVVVVVEEEWAAGLAVRGRFFFGGGGVGSDEMEEGAGEKFQVVVALWCGLLRLWMVSKWSCLCCWWWWWW